MAVETGPISLGIIGAGWRSLFFLRIAKELPERFSVAGIVARDAAKGAALTAQWGVPTFRTLDALLQSVPQTPHFMILSVPRQASPGLIRECVDRNLPVLGETPPAPDIAGLQELTAQVRERGGRVQVAEQYFLQPLHQALLTVAHSGKLGTPTQAQISVAHGYHGLSLIRKYLGVGFENVTITASEFRTPTASSPGRNGLPESYQVRESTQTIAQLRFDSGKWAIFDFTGDQYFSFIRGPRLLVRGERGEILTDGETSAVVRYLIDERTPIRERLTRIDTGHGGNLEGYHHRGYTFAGEWVYRNPYAATSHGYTGGRLADDEIAIADMLGRMGEYAQDGPDVYSLAEASQDTYLDLLISQAVRTGQPVTSETQPWAK